MKRDDDIDQDGNLTETVQQVISILDRRKWLILLPMLVVSLAGIAVIVHLPYKYTSEATLVVVQPQIPQRYVESLPMTSIVDEVNALKLEVLSRRRLNEIIEAYGLYPDKRGKSTPDSLANLMRKDIQIEPIRIPGRVDFNTFTVSFQAEDPVLAQQVTNRLTSIFIEENLKSQEMRTSVTTKFLTDQVATVKKKLDEQEKKISDFKMSNMGGLPEQQQANLGVLTDLRIQLQTVSGSLSRAQQQKTYLGSTLKGHVARLQAERSTLLNRYTAQHPEVGKKDQAIDRANSLLNRLESGTGIDKSPNDGLDDPVLAQLRGQIDALLTELSTLPKDEQRLRAEISQYQGRLNLTPLRDQQLSSLLRDYELLKKDYADLLDKQFSSQLSAEVEEKQQGQQYRLVDPPTLPIAPSSPQRVKLSLGALAAGFVIGFGLAFGLEMLDSSIGNVKEMRSLVDTPIVVGIPTLLTHAEERSRGWVRRMEWCAGTLIALAMIAAELYVIRTS